MLILHYINAIWVKCLGNIKITSFSKIGDDSNGYEKTNDLSQKTVFFSAYALLDSPFDFKRRFYEKV